MTVCTAHRPSRTAGFPHWIRIAGTPQRLWLPLKDRWDERRRKNLNKHWKKTAISVYKWEGGWGSDDTFTCMFCHTPTHVTQQLPQKWEKKKALDVNILRVYLTPHTFLPSHFLKTLELRGCDTLEWENRSRTGAGLWSYNILVFQHFNQSRHQNTSTTQFKKSFKCCIIHSSLTHK